ncbi:hypothetical protein DL763_003329 [Monosporascus cannonballus]|nr:hypothetical protein DL763_003329 [Monosporascus cannonballus]
MTRKLKHHEQKLLRKVDFITWKQDNDHRDAAVRRRYMIQKPEDYNKYNRLCGVSSYYDTIAHASARERSTGSSQRQSLRQLAHRLSLLPPDNPVRRKTEKLLLDKLYDMGILSSASKLSSVENNVTVSAFARRRLPVVMTRLRMAEHLKAAVTMIEQGHVRVGTEVITDPAFLVTRSMEACASWLLQKALKASFPSMFKERPINSRQDFVTWAPGSKIKRNIMKYRDKLDDFELL